MKKFLSAACIVSALALASFGTACEIEVPPEVPSADLAQGGVYVAYNNGFSECTKGCDQIKKGDLILEVNGEKVSSATDVRLSKIATGEPVKLKVFKKATQSTIDVELVATPSDKLQPIKEAPPFWTVGAAELDKAPDWARKTLFGHASPSAMLVSSEGGILDGRQLLGKKRFIVFWDHGTREEQAAAADFLKVLQVAQADLQAAGVDILFTQITFPGNNRQAAMNDGQMREFQAKAGDPKQPAIPMYRFPNATEHNAAREIGLEGSTPYIQYLRAAPAIILLDENGIIRWHSEGIQPLPSDSKIPSATQYTIIQAIMFAQENL